MPSPPLLVLCIPCTSFLTSSSIVPLNMGALNVCSGVALDCTFTQAYNSRTITVWQEAVDDWHLVDLIWRKRGKGRAVEKKEREIVQRHWGVLLRFVLCSVTPAVYPSAPFSVCLRMLHCIRERKTVDSAHLWFRAPGKEILLPPRGPTMTIYPWGLSYSGSVRPLQWVMGMEEDEVAGE